MKARDIYNTMSAITEPIHSYSDQMIAIAKWIESEFEYKPQKQAISHTVMLSCSKCKGKNIMQRSDGVIGCTDCLHCWRHI